MTARILVTGSRDWTDREAVASELALALSTYGPDAVLVHGHCPTGADAIADELWSTAGLQVERHPADWARDGNAAGLIRNQKMVDLGADLCIAFPLAASRGTRHCMAAARRAGIRVCEVTP